MGHVREKERGRVKWWTNTLFRRLSLEKERSGRSSKKVAPREELRVGDLELA